VLDNDRDGVPDAQDMDDDNDGRVDVDAGSGLPESVLSDLVDLSNRFPSQFPVDSQVPRRTPFNDKRVGRDPFSMAGWTWPFP